MASSMKRLRHWGLALGLGLADAMGYLPVRWARRGGGLVGRLAFRLARRERQRALDHLAIAFPRMYERHRIALARANFVHLGEALGEFMVLPRKGRAWVEELVDVEGEENLLAAAAHPRGALYLTGHLGNWETMAAWASRRIPLVAVVRENVHEEVTARYTRIREQFGTRQLMRRRDGSGRVAKRIVEELARQQVIGLLIDQDLGGKGAFVPFFGRPALTVTAPAYLALRTGACVFWGFCRRERRPDGRWHHVLRYAPPYLVRPGVPPEEAVARGLALEEGEDLRPVERPDPEDVLRYTIHFNQVLEAEIRRNPTQWVWMHRRWRSRPPVEGEVTR